MNIVIKNTNTYIENTNTRLKKLLITTSLITCLISTHIIYPMEDDQKYSASEANLADEQCAAAVAVEIGAAAETAHEQCAAVSVVAPKTLAAFEKHPLYPPELQSFFDIHTRNTTPKKKLLSPRETELFFDICTRETTQENRTQKAKQLLKTIDINAQTNDYFGDTLLMHAINNTDYAAMIDILINLGADIDKSNNTDDTPLSYAVMLKQETELALALIRLGVHVNTRNKTLWTPLNRATYNNNTNVVAALILAGATYIDREFNSFSDPMKTIITAAIDVKNNLTDQWWTSEDFVASHALPLSQSREELDIRHLVAAYANPYDETLSFFLHDNTQLHTLIKEYAQDETFDNQLTLHQAVKIVRERRKNLAIKQAMSNGQQNAAIVATEAGLADEQIAGAQ